MTKSANIHEGNNILWCPLLVLKAMVLRKKDYNRMALLHAAFKIYWKGNYARPITNTRGIMGALQLWKKNGRGKYVRTEEEQNVYATKVLGVYTSNKDVQDGTGDSKSGGGEQVYFMRVLYSIFGSCDRWSVDQETCHLQVGQLQCWRLRR